MANPAVVVDFVANTRDLQAGMRSATGATSGFGARMKSMGKTAVAAAGAAGVGALIATVRTGIDEFSEAQKVSAQTAAVLKSTGKAAGVSAKDIETLAGSLMKKTGVDDEAIQSGENLLLTFTNIRNEAGKGNDVFNQATKATLDLSVALGQDMKTSAVQVGKALNDPVKGMTALQRVGVSFTEGQKEQVKALVDSGKTMEAQKLILAELNKEFGGSAEAAGKTLPGQLNILKQQFSNLAGELVASVMPAVTTFVGLLLDVMNNLGPLKAALPVVVGAFAALAAVVLVVKAATAAYQAVALLAQAATAVWTAAQWLLNAALLANPIGLVIVAIAALVAAFVVAYKTSDTFRRIVDDAFDAVLAAARAVWNWLRGNWPMLLGILTGPIGAAIGVLATHWRQIRDGFMDAFDAVRDAASTAAGFVRSTMSSLGSWLSGFVSGTLSAVLGRARDVFDFIADGARDAYAAVQRNLNGIVGFIEGLIGRVRSAASSIADAIKGPINAVLRAWNSISLTIPSIKIPKIKVGKKTFGGGSFGGQTIGFPNVPLLAAGGIVTDPTLALIGESGPEAVIPLDRMPAPSVEVRVFIGDQELRGVIRTEVAARDDQTARTLLAGR